MSDNYQELAEDALEDSSTYEYKGQPLYFSYRHYYAMLAILKEAEMSSEEQILLIFWISTHNPNEISQLRKKWRKNKELVFDEFEQVPETFNLTPGSVEMIEIAEISSKLWQDIENSADTIAENKDNDKNTLPKK